MNTQRDVAVNTAECGDGVISFEKALATYEAEKTFDTLNIRCYCLQNLKEMGVNVGTGINWTIVDDSGTETEIVQPCYEWNNGYQLANALAILLSVSLTLINTILRELIKFCAKFEGHHTVTEELSSSFSKMWIIQFVNTAVILLIINNKLAEGIIVRLLKITSLDNLFFNGEYLDFDTEWYQVVGVTIFTTAFINAVVPFGQIYAIFLGRTKQCFDRGCSFDKKKTSKMLQSEYEAVYLGGNIDYANRFSVLIAMIWVVMMFSAVIPILYFAGFLLCFVSYWTDKQLFVSWFRIPPRHGSNMVRQARGVIEWSLIVHLFMGLYMISNPAIFADEDADDAVAFLAYYAKFIGIGVTWLTGVESVRFEQTHTILYSAGIGIFLICFIIEKVSGTCSSIMGKICCCCLYKDTQEASFSNDLFNDIAGDKQSDEYT